LTALWRKWTKEWSEGMSSSDMLTPVRLLTAEELAEYGYVAKFQSSDVTEDELDQVAEFLNGTKTGALNKKALTSNFRSEIIQGIVGGQIVNQLVDDGRMAINNGVLEFA